MKNKIKTTWDLSVFYRSPTDPKIKKDMAIIEKAYQTFAKKYKNADFTSTELKLLKSLLSYERLLETISHFHPGSYLNYVLTLDMSDHVAEANLNKLYERYVKASNNITFFHLKIGKISLNVQKQYLSSKKLERHKYFLENIFKTAKHNLNESEEKIMSLKRITSREMWITSNEKLLSIQNIFWDKKEIPISEALEILSSLPNKKRRNLHKLIMEKVKSVSDLAEAEINAVYTDKKVNDELRNFKNPYDETLLSDDTEIRMVNALVESVTDNFRISHSFYKIKAKLLGLSKLQYPDRAASVGKISKPISFLSGLKIIKKAFEKADPEFATLLYIFLQRGQIDLYPKKGKASGAFCSGNQNAPTFIMLNYAPNMKSIMTLAHEMGHAFHFEFLKAQPLLYQGISTPVAEVASTFFEQVVFDDLFKNLSKEEQVIALHNKINDEISTVFRQIACFNFERDLHEAIREKGFLPKENISSLLNKHMKSYLGPLFQMSELDGYAFGYWGHIRNFFYVYSYSYGCLISKALYRKYKQDKKYLNKIKNFLQAGNSKSPFKIFRDIGIDTSDPNFWKEGLKEIEDDIKLLAKLTKKSR